MLFDIIAVAVSSVVTIILSKTRIRCRNDCVSCSYNEHQIDINKLSGEEADEDKDLPEDSFKTLPPPATPRTRASLPAMDLTRLKKNM